MIGSVAVFFTIEVLKPPMLAPQRLEEVFDRELIVWLARDTFADKRRMIDRMRRVAAAGAGIEREFGEPLIIGVPQHVIPCAVVRRTGGFRTDARRRVEELPHRNLRLARIAERLRPRDELKRRVAERHLARCFPLLALL